MRNFNPGCSDISLAFEPGFKINSEHVCRTFQPSCVVRNDGSIIAFCQGRLRNGRDDDPKVVLMSTSDNGGKSWSSPKVVSGRMNHYAMSAYLSQKEKTERISVMTMVDLRGTENLYAKDYAEMKDQTGIDIDLAGRETPMIFCRFYSDDGGESWNQEMLLGERSPLNHCYEDGVLIMFNPIGQVHVMPEGPHKGRCIIGGPATVVPTQEPLTDYFRNHAQSGSGIIYSDDQGESWHADGMIMDYLANEASAVSINSGKELLLIRRLNKPKRFKGHPSPKDVLPGPMQRLAHTSSDCGRTWSNPFLVNISDVRCHGTLARAGGRLLFSIPNGSDLTDSEKTLRSERRNGAIYFSDDEGQTWHSKIVDRGTFSYSTVTPLNSGQYMTLYAKGAMGEKGVGCRIFDDSWLNKEDGGKFQ